MKKNYITACILLAVFILFTLLVKIVDVKPIGPGGTEVGFATANESMHEGVGGLHISLYKISDFLGNLCIASGLVFAMVGLYQLITRKSFAKVDIDLYVLGGFYILLGIVYVIFELIVINYRPEIMEISEGIEASYPSSHTILSICSMTAAITQLNSRIRNDTLKKILIMVCSLVMIATVVLRLLSGAHWLTDILGAILLSASLCFFHAAVRQTVIK